MPKEVGNDPSWYQKTSNHEKRHSVEQKRNKLQNR